MSKNVTTKKIYPPGDFGIWIVIYVELITFGLLFVGYAFSRKYNLEMFNTSQLTLDTQSGFINTLILVTSSYFVVKALKSIQNSSAKSLKEASSVAAKWLLAAILFGGMFLLNKIIEFSAIFEQGITLSTNKFYMFYLLLTMFHFMHVLLGTIVLFNIYNKTKIQGYSAKDCVGMESGASYWHMVDLLWIVLFPLVYIIR